MKKVLFFLIIVVCFSCDNKTHYCINKIFRDTIASYHFIENEVIWKSKFKVVLEDSVYTEEKLNSIFKNIGLYEILKEKANDSRSPFFYIYTHNGSFTMNDTMMYNDRNYVIKGWIDFHYPEYYIFENDFELRKRKALIEVLEFAVLEDSLKEQDKQDVKLSFMGYRLGESYTKLRGNKQKCVEIEESFFLENIDEVEVFFYDDIIYRIDIYIRNNDKGISSVTFDKIKELYQNKYGGNKGKWNFKDGGIRLETKWEKFILKEGHWKRSTIIDEKMKEYIAIGGWYVSSKGKPLSQVPTQKKYEMTEIKVTYFYTKIDSVLHVNNLKESFVKEKNKCEYIFP